MNTLFRVDYRIGGKDKQVAIVAVSIDDAIERLRFVMPDVVIDAIAAYPMEVWITSKAVDAAIEETR